MGSFPFVIPFLLYIFTIQILPFKNCKNFKKTFYQAHWPLIGKIT